ncbi:hypothetical protein PUN28_013226 [Cardiocondyla obscurior]|uniref:Uncharacterized protein n=1 Tax=Cardiocondyla obscurior TaxID=286306 RepID=A0AAW2FA91_9HYME
MRNRYITRGDSSASVLFEKLIKVIASSKIVQPICSRNSRVCTVCKRERERRKEKGIYSQHCHRFSSSIIRFSGVVRSLESRRIFRPDGFPKWARASASEIDLAESVTRPRNRDDPTSVLGRALLRK